MKTNMKYTCELSTIKKEGETNGRKWAIRKLNLKDEQGINLEVDTFDNVMSGEIVEGEIITTERGSNFKKITPKAVAGANFKQAQVEKSMERKEQSIGKFQDNKEFSIMTASTLRMAVDVVTAFDSKAQLSSQDIKNEILYWRQWLMENWSVDKTDVNPF